MLSIASIFSNSIEFAPGKKKLNLPVTISELGIDIFDHNNLELIAEFTCRDDSEIHFLPFEISKQDIIETIKCYEQQEIKI